MAIHELYPYLRVSDGAAALAWHAEVFQATERLRLVDPGDGRIGHEWLVGHAIEEVTPEEMQRRWNQMVEG